MIIDWDSLSVRDWYDVYVRLPRTNIVQSYAYAKAIRQIHFQNTSFGAIHNTARDIIGLVQMQNLSSFGFKRTFIDRGPLWLAPNPEADQNFWSVIARQYPARFLHKRRFIPEIESTPDAQTMFDNLEFKKTGEGYQTIWLDLTPPLEDIKNGFDKKWRNSLHRAQRENLNIQIDTDAQMLGPLLKNYMLDRAQKKYAGASPKFIRAMEGYKSEHDNSFIVSACDDTGIPIAMMYFWRHGPSATYQIGWANDLGRKTSAHYAMMWRAIEHLKSMGVRNLDLGGINPDTAPGMTKFKSGLGGHKFETAGIYA